MFIRPLVGIGRSDRAFALAEQYEDFRTLVELCNEAQLRSPARLDSYLERYKQPFAFELYAYYLEHGQPRVLLEQKSEHSQLVLDFLAQPGTSASRGCTTLRCSDTARQHTRSSVSRWVRACLRRGSS